MKYTKNYDLLYKHHEVDIGSDIWVHTGIPFHTYGVCKDWCVDEDGYLQVEVKMGTHLIKRYPGYKVSYSNSDERFSVPFDKNDLREYLRELQVENIGYRKALQEISDWVLPKPDFELDRGIRGVKDHIRSIASKALLNKWRNK